MARPVTHTQRRFFLAFQRAFSASCRRRAIRDISELPDRVRPSYVEARARDFLSLKWPTPPRNVLLVKKEHSESATEALLEFAKHITSTYPNISVVAEPYLAKDVHDQLPFDIFAPSPGTFPDTPNSPHSTLTEPSPLHDKVDICTTFGGDGTILHASSLFSTSSAVPPILAFSMGTLGFLGEYKFADYKNAFREAYFSGAPHTTSAPALAAEADPWSQAFAGDGPGNTSDQGWGELRGKQLGKRRGARVLLRHRLNVSFSNPGGPNLATGLSLDSTATWNGGNTHKAMNEVLLHRGAESHLMHISVEVNGRILTEAVADGILVSTPTGSTAYSLSAGGSIIHPLVPSLLLTPVCPRSLSFRPLVLPANSEVVLRLGEKNRGRTVEVSVDGDRRREGAGPGMEIRVTGEPIERAADGWSGGVPCLIRGGPEKEMDDGWVGGLNGLLKWNHPFGDDA